MKSPEAVKTLTELVQPSSWNHYFFSARIIVSNPRLTWYISSPESLRDFYTHVFAHRDAWPLDLANPKPLGRMTMLLHYNGRSEPEDAADIDSVEQMRGVEELFEELGKWGVGGGYVTPSMIDDVKGKARARDENEEPAALDPLEFSHITLYAFPKVALRAYKGGKIAKALAFVACNQISSLGCQVNDSTQFAGDARASEDGSRDDASTIYEDCNSELYHTPATEDFPTLTNTFLGLSLNDPTDLNLATFGDYNLSTAPSITPLTRELGPPLDPVPPFNDILDLPVYRNIVPLPMLDTPPRNTMPGTFEVDSSLGEDEDHEDEVPRNTTSFSVPSTNSPDASTASTSDPSTPSTSTMATSNGSSISSVDVAAADSANLDDEVPRPMVCAGFYPPRRNAVVLGLGCDIPIPRSSSVSPDRRSEDKKPSTSVPSTLPPHLLLIAAPLQSPSDAIPPQILPHIKKLEIQSGGVELSNNLKLLSQEGNQIEELVLNFFGNLNDLGDRVDTTSDFLSNLTSLTTPHLRRITIYIRQASNTPEAAIAGKIVNSRLGEHAKRLGVSVDVKEYRPNVGYDDGGECFDVTGFRFF
ncbi:unnamed protein product [Somion occarium]